VDVFRFQVDNNQNDGMEYLAHDFDGIVLGQEGTCYIWNGIGTRRNIRAFHRY